MAVDQALLEFAAQQNCAVLRIYQWSEPTLSIGYFQRNQDRQSHPPSEGLTWVRRASGGGAIIHHHDITYSLSVPQRTSRLGASTELYDLVHGAWVEWLKQNGYPASKWSPQNRVQQGGDSKPFLCFERRATGDIVVGEHKLLGSAQRRIQGGMLQHGSLLIRTSGFSPQLIGLSNLACGNKWQYLAEKSNIAKMLADALEHHFEIPIRWFDTLPQDCHGVVLAISRNYADKSWLMRL